MLNQIILWAMLILPWGLLFFLDKQRVSEFLPAGLFSSLLITIVFQIYERWDIVKVKETIVPLTNVPPARMDCTLCYRCFFCTLLSEIFGYTGFLIWLAIWSIVLYSWDYMKNLGSSILIK